MIDQVKNNINNLSSSGSNKSSPETKNANVEIKQVNQSSAKTKLDSGEVSKFITKEKIKDMAKFNEAKIITTEKDYLRIRDENKKGIDVAKIKLDIKNNDEFVDFLNKKLWK